MKRKFLFHRTSAQAGLTLRIIAIRARITDTQRNTAARLAGNAHGSLMTATLVLNPGVCMTDIASEYGQRTCLECGTKFVPAYPAQVTCSVSCRKELARKMDRKAESAKRKRIKERVRRLEQENAMLRERLKLCGVSL